jgi:hypothetical protein
MALIVDDDAEGPGTTGTPMAEAVISSLLLSLSLAALVGTALAVWGFRNH